MMNTGKKFVLEPAKQIAVVGEADVVVCGGGPAGSAAAVAAARAGASCILLEATSCCGGIMTSGLMPNIIDAAGKKGFLAELLADMERRNAVGNYNSYQPEAVKCFLDNALMEAGVRLRFQTSVTTVIRDDHGAIQAVITESPSGREAFLGKIFIDATGDGDVAAQAGCTFECGSPETGAPQAASLCALCHGINATKIPDFCEQKEDLGKRTLRQALEEAGCPPSYRMPTLFKLREDGFLLMSNHEYGVHADNADEISAALLHARRELDAQMQALAKAFPTWTNVWISSSAAMLGLREGRRIKGLYHLSVEDLREGRSQPDAVCRVTFPVDIHANDKHGQGSYGTAGILSRPYDIPLRSLCAAEVSNLLLAGRCIDGDYYAHASYRVLGNAIPMGEAAGILATVASRTGVTPGDVPYGDFLSAGGNPHSR